MTRRPAWTAGFYAGVCSALACIAGQEDPGSVLWDETVMACGGDELARYAHRENDMYAKEIGETVRRKKKERA